MEKRGRKLLIAAVGVATIAYVACSDETTTSGNLVAPPEDSAVTEDSGPGDAPADTTGDATDGG